MVESAEVVQLVRPRAGHFDLGTGYHGDLWLDLDALFLKACPATAVRGLAGRTAAGSRRRRGVRPAGGGRAPGLCRRRSAGGRLPGRLSRTGSRPRTASPGCTVGSAAGGWASSTTRSTLARRWRPAWRSCGARARSPSPWPRSSRWARRARWFRPGWACPSTRPHDAEPGVARAGVSPVRRRRPGHAGCADHAGRRPVSATSRSMTGASAPTSTGAWNMPAGVRSTMA